jgi:hypothetical protein
LIINEFLEPVDLVDSIPGMNDVFLAEDVASFEETLVAVKLVEGHEYWYVIQFPY